MISPHCSLVNDGRSSESEKYFQRALSYEPAHKNALLYYKQVLFGAAALWVKGMDSIRIPIDIRRLKTVWPCLWNTRIQIQKDVQMV